MSGPDRSDGRPLAGATWSLFVGLGFLLMGVGLFATALSIDAESLHFSNIEIGLLGASYYGGFLIGAILTPSALAGVGHIRVYTALSSLLSAAILFVGLTSSPLAWIALRFFSGACIAGLYVVAESWLNQVASNNRRGRLLGVYMVVTSGAYGIGQALVGTVDLHTVQGFAIAALFTSLAVAPVALSEDAAPPPVVRGATIRLRRLARLVPTGVGTCLLVGIAHGSLVTMGVIYATRSGLNAGDAGRFVAATGIGGMLAQWPISTASDELDRRFVGVVVSCGAVVASTWLLFVGAHGWKGLLAMGVLGGLSFPLYSVAAAYANDWVEPHEMSGAASSLIVVYGVGALVGPLVTSALNISVGIDGYPWSMIALHALIVVFLIYRMFAWRAPIATTTWNDASLSTRAFFIPANVVWMGRKIRTRSISERE